MVAGILQGISCEAALTLDPEHLYQKLCRKTAHFNQHLCLLPLQAPRGTAPGTEFLEDAR